MFYKKLNVTVIVIIDDTNNYLNNNNDCYTSNTFLLFINYKCELLSIEPKIRQG